MTEEWRPVVGWEGLYEVSSEGRVRSRGRGPGRRDGRILRPFQGRYAQVSLCRAGSPVTQYVHRLVATAFLGEPDPGQTDVLHYDDNGLNNRVSNLRWGSVSDNLRDSVRNGGYRNQNTGKTHCVRGHDLPSSRRCGECTKLRRLGLPDPEDRRHGSLTGYTMGCRCPDCRSAMRQYDKERYASRKRRPGQE